MPIATDSIWSMTSEAGNGVAPAPRHRMAGTPQQEALWDALIHGTSHIQVEARAGTGKSTACREGMHRLLEADPSLAIRYCCFNKSIADEFRTRCPAGVEVGTMHSFGLRVLGQAFAPQVDNQKSYQILDTIPGGSKLPRYHRKPISKLVSLAKNLGLRPDSDARIDTLIDIARAYDVIMFARDEDVIISYTLQVLDRAASQTSAVDYDDMLWLPVIHDLPFPSVDHLFIDEAQDLNPIQHELVGLMNPNGRTTVVGDPFQSIYAFRGADSESMPKLRDRLGAEVLPLTVTWRCPSSHVELARELVADLEAAPSAPVGELTSVPDIGQELVYAMPGDLVLCRANAPLVGACLRAIASRRRACMRGRAFGDQLLDVVRRACKESNTIAEFGRDLDRWLAREVGRLSERDGTEDVIEQARDRAGCLHAIAGSCSSVSEVPGAILALFSEGTDSDRIVFSSIHRAKGSEAGSVFFIDKPYSAVGRRSTPQPWEEQQRLNLRYVALTRSKRSLTMGPSIG